jgi:hypothetical protein
MTVLFYLDFCSTIPAESSLFFDILWDTVHSEIGACLEKTCQIIPLNESASMLNFTHQTAIKEYDVKMLGYMSCSINGC